MDPAVFGPVAVQIAQRVPQVTGSVDLPAAGRGEQAWRGGEVPAWVSGQLEAEGFSQRLESKLRTARAAEADAVSHLREKVLALEIGKNLTLGQAAGEDQALSKAVDRALLRTRVIRTDYHPDGSAGVRATLNLNDVWAVLTAGR
jgi:hypothetical protein